MKTKTVYHYVNYQGDILCTGKPWTVNVNEVDDSKCNCKKCIKMEWGSKGYSQ